MKGVHDKLGAFWVYQSTVVATTQVYPLVFLMSHSMRITMEGDYPQVNVRVYLMTNRASPGFAFTSKETERSSYLTPCTLPSFPILIDYKTYNPCISTTVISSTTYSLLI